jgi:hypothetical protein
MPAWVLECVKCRLKFIHALIEERGILNFELPLKPVFPLDGISLECPGCKSTAIYQRFDLRYQAQPA